MRAKVIKCVTLITMIRLIDDCYIWGLEYDPRLKVGKYLAFNNGWYGNELYILMAKWLSCLWNFLWLSMSNVKYHYYESKILYPDLYSINSFSCITSKKLLCFDKIKLTLQRHHSKNRMSKIQLYYRNGDHNIQRTM